MSRYLNAWANVSDMDAAVRQGGVFRDTAHAMDIARLHFRLDHGERPSERDIERIRATYWPAIPPQLFQKTAAHVLNGATAREQANRLADVIYGPINPQTGLPMGASPMREQARALAQSVAVQEFVAPLTERMEKTDQHRDRQNGVNEQARVEQARKAALQNPDTIRRNDVERAWSQHAPEPVLYAEQRREGQAQRDDRWIDRKREQMVRNADPHRAPDRGDDRRDDIRLAIDFHENEAASLDEINLAANPVLEAVDDQLTYAASMGQE